MSAHRNHLLRHACPDCHDAADHITELEAHLGNAVGAIIDSGGYCEGPHDVAAAIYRLTAERDALSAEQDPNWHLAPWFGQPTPPVGLEGHTDPKEADEDDICMTHNSYRKAGTRICMVLAFVDEPGVCRFVRSGPPPATTENQA